MDMLLDAIYRWMVTLRNQTMWKSPSAQDPYSIIHLYVSWEIEVVEFQPGIYILYLMFTIPKYCI